MSFGESFLDVWFYVRLLMHTGQLLVTHQGHILDKTSV